VATRYDKLAVRYEATVHIAAINEWLNCIGYVLAVACSQRIPTEGGSGSARADTLAALRPVACGLDRG
jgi:hypothetical protein